MDTPNTTYHVLNVRFNEIRAGFGSDGRANELLLDDFRLLSESEANNLIGLIQDWPTKAELRKMRGAEIGDTVIFCTLLTTMYLHHPFLFCRTHPFDNLPILFIPSFDRRCTARCWYVNGITTNNSHSLTSILWVFIFTFFFFILFPFISMYRCLMDCFILCVFDIERFHITLYNSHNNPIAVTLPH